MSVHRGKDFEGADGKRFSPAYTHGHILLAGSCIFGINPCDVACANVHTGVAVVVSRHKENLPDCALI